ncbi:hypothetical protein QTP88_001787 [Uroleucon formosanum]
MVFIQQHNTNSSSAIGNQIKNEGKKEKCKDPIQNCAPRPLFILLTIVGKTAAEAIIIREHIKGQTLAIFIEGLRQPMKTIIKASKPASLELAMKESLLEERVYKSDKEAKCFFNNPKPGGKTQYCSRCKTNTHQTENCRFIKGTQTGKYNQSTNTQTKIETASH